MVNGRRLNRKYGGKAIKFLRYAYLDYRYGGRVAHVRCNYKTCLRLRISGQKYQCNQLPACFHAIEARLNEAYHAWYASLELFQGDGYIVKVAKMLGANLRSADDVAEHFTITADADPQSSRRILNGVENWC